MTFKKIISYTFVFIFLLTVFVFADDFANLETAFKSGDFEKAESILTNQKDSFSKFYNLGNVNFQKKNFGNAYYYYLKASTIEPRNKDLRHNISLINEKTGAQIDYDLEFFLGFFSLNELIILTLFISSFFLFFFFISKKKFVILISGSFLSVLLITTSVKFFVTKNSAIIISQTNLKSGPDETYTNITIIKETSKIKILSKRNDWFEVKTNDNIIGWIKKEFIGEI